MSKNTVIVTVIDNDIIKFLKSSQGLNKNSRGFIAAGRAILPLTAYLAETSPRTNFPRTRISSQTVDRSA